MPAFLSSASPEKYRCMSGDSLTLVSPASPPLQLPPHSRNNDTRGSLMMNRHIEFVIAGAATMLCFIAYPVLAGVSPTWQELSAVGRARTHGITAFWGGLPELDGKTRIKVLDVDGPGVITSIHVSAMAADGIEGFGSPPVADLIIRVFYDGQAKAAIEMPLMDFLGDVQCKSQYFSSIFLSKVKESPNFRIPMPFREHVTIEVENPSDRKVNGYLELTYDVVEAVSKESGDLRVDYRTGNLSATSPNTMFRLDTPGVMDRTFDWRISDHGATARLGGPYQ